MLRKMSRSFQKDQNMGHPTLSDNGCESYFQSDLMGQNQRTNSFFSVPGLFVGLNPKGLSDCDSVRSPTSPLDFRVFSNLGNPFRSTRSSHDGHYKSWDCSKVGLSIIDSLDDNTKLSDRVSRSSDCKNIIIGPRMRIKSSNFGKHIECLEKPKSLPKNYAIFTHSQIKSSNLQNENSGSLFEIGEGPLEAVTIGKLWSCSLDSGKCFSSFDNFAYSKPNLSSRNFCLKTRTAQVNSPQFIGRSSNFNNSFPSNLSSIPVSMGSGHGLNGSLSVSEIDLSEDHTHAFSHGPGPKTIHNGAVECSEISLSFPSNNFLSFCYSCKKNLDGEDIYMYRGEKAFCSLICREQEILIDEELEEIIDDLPENIPEDHGNKPPQQGMFITA